MAQRRMGLLSYADWFSRPWAWPRAKNPWRAASQRAYSKSVALLAHKIQPRTHRRHLRQNALLGRGAGAVGVDLGGGGVVRTADARAQAPPGASRPQTPAPDWLPRPCRRIRSCNPGHLPPYGSTAGLTEHLLPRVTRTTWCAREAAAHRASGCLMYFAVTLPGNTYLPAGTVHASSINPHV